jgi:hypothetical protein
VGVWEQKQPNAMWRPLHPKTKEELVKACRDARADDYTNTIDNLEVRGPAAASWVVSSSLRECKSCGVGAGC